MQGYIESVESKFLEIELGLTVLEQLSGEELRVQTQKDILNLYEEIVQMTPATSENGKRARRGMIEFLVQVGEVNLAKQTLTSLMTQVNISPDTFGELRRLFN